MKGLKNELAWESAGELAFFIAPIDRIQLALGTPDFRSLFGGASPPASATLRPPPSPRQKAGQWLFRAKSSFPLLNRLSSLLNRRQHNIIQKKFPMLARSGISFNLFPAFKENLDRINKIHRMG
jgi:hypothetical protein